MHRVRFRPLVAASLPVLAIAVAWLRQEDPALVLDGLAVALLALLPAALATWKLRAAAIVVAALGTAWIAFGAVPWALVPGIDADWLEPVRSGFPHGLGDYYEVSLPFDPGERPEMHGVLLVALLGCSLAVSCLVAAGRTVLATLALAVGTAWPAIPVAGRGEILLGVLVLTAALWLVVVSRLTTSWGYARAAAWSAALLAVAAFAATTEAAARDGALDWRSWDFYDPPGEPVGVRYVWDANYEGVAFPERVTTVLRIKAPPRQFYWRASTLDLFVLDRWIEHAYPNLLAPPRGLLPDDPSLPKRATTRRADWVRQDVEVEGLRDDHLVAAATPVSLESSSVARVFFLQTGLMRSTTGLDRGDRYSVWSWAPQPDPDELLQVRPVYPAAVRRFLSLEQTGTPVFGMPGREAEMEKLFTDERAFGLWAYRPLWDAARRLTRTADSPYAATLAVERWLRLRGGFRYEERPQHAEGVPPLVDFVTRGRAGYCQHFAGAMAVMLRFLGIPSRVAVGFTSGQRKDGEWVVTDHNAHAWVEAWFDGYGWLPFDPTPGRGNLGATYTIASDSADAVRALRGARLSNLELDLASIGRSTAPVEPVAVTAEDDSNGEWLLAAAAVLAAVLAALALAKRGRRRLRYRGGDPRRVAAAVHLELRDWLLDQGVETGRGAGVSALAHAVERDFGVPSRRYAVAVGRARYAPPAQSRAAAAHARRELRILLRGLREVIGGRRRLRGFLALRSLRRARA